MRFRIRTYHLDRDYIENRAIQRLNAHLANALREGFEPVSIGLASRTEVLMVFKEPGKELGSVRVLVVEHGKLEEGEHPEESEALARAVGDRELVSLCEISDRRFLVIVRE